MKSIVQLQFDGNLNHNIYVLSLVLGDFKRIYDNVEIEEIDANVYLITFSFHETI